PTLPHRAIGRLDGTHIAVEVANRRGLHPLPEGRRVSARLARSLANASAFSTYSSSVRAIHSVIPAAVRIAADTRATVVDPMSVTTGIPIHRPSSALTPPPCGYGSRARSIS